MANYNVTIKKYNGSDWDRIYPRTTAENIISGTLNIERIPNIPVSKLTDNNKNEKIDVKLLPAIALTNVQSYANWEMLSGIYDNDNDTFQEGDVVIILSGTKKGTYVHNGKTMGTADEDFTLMELPSGVVNSVAGKTGTVTLNKSDVGLDKVDNTSDNDKPVSAATWVELNKKVDKNTPITGGTKTKITYDSKGLVTGGADLTPSDIPELNATKITSGKFGVDRIPDLPITKITGLETTLAEKQPKIKYVSLQTIPTDPDNPYEEGTIIFHAYD